MSCLRLQGSLLALGLMLGCRLGMAIDAGAIPAPATSASDYSAATPALAVASPPSSTPASPPAAAPFATSNSTYLLPPGNPAANPTPGPPAMMALPVNTAPLPADASTTRKFYTLTASLREIYDDNVTGSNNNQPASLETVLSPSILVDFPTPEGEFTGRYTFNLTYYSVGPNGNNGSGNNNGQLEYTHEFVAQFSHNFNERFGLSCAEDFRSYVEPSIDQSTGTPYQNGQYIANVLSGSLSAQWTPLFGTTTSYSNSIVRYSDSNVGQVQNSIENTGSQTFTFAVFPKVSLSVGGIADEIGYDSTDRGYNSYTGFVGAMWEALPSLTFSARGGGSFTQTAQSQSQISPYAALSANWSLGAHSSLNFSYGHELTPSDQAGANGQTSDRFNAGFNYIISPSLTAHLDGIYTRSVTQQYLLTSDNSSLPAGYVESDYQMDTGLAYHFDKYIDFDGGVIFSGVDSDINALSYTRAQTYFGVRGTY